jgi:hypothetical protein
VGLLPGFERKRSCLPVTFPVPMLRSWNGRRIVPPESFTPPAAFLNPPPPGNNCAESYPRGFLNAYCQAIMRSLE